MTGVNPEARDVSKLAGPDGQEPGEQTLAVRAAGQETGDEIASHPEPVDANHAEMRRMALQGSLVRHLAEKFFWKLSKAGNPYLSPLSEFLNAIYADTPKFIDFGDGLITSDKPDKKPSTEAALALTLTGEVGQLLTTVTALDQQEREQFIRYWKDRAARNGVYAAINQFELDKWVANSAKRNVDARQHENFGEKESRRDGFAIKAAVYRRMIVGLGQADAVLDQPFIVKCANGIIYQQAEMRGKEVLNPTQDAAQDTAAVQSTVLAARPFE